MQEQFVFGGLPMRVIFGMGTLTQLGDEIDRLGARRVVALSTPQQADQVAAIVDVLGARCVGHFSGAVMHTPVAVTDDALAEVRSRRADGIVSIGGGSTIGLGKAIALRTDLPQIAVPTTYAGSEMTPILGETRDGVKTTQRGAAILPETTIYDVALTMGLPRMLSATSGLNAVAHAVEALYAADRNPVTTLMAESAVAALADALPRIVDDPDDQEARSAALYGAWLCGIVLGATGMGLHHKLCHTLGGSFDLPHAETHAVILPHALSYNSQAAGEAASRIARALRVEDAALGLHELARRLEAPTSLRGLGLAEADLDRAAALATASPYPNPRPLDRDAIRALLDDAFHGRAPRA